MKLFRGLRGFDRIVAGALVVGFAGLLISLISAFANLDINSGDSGPYPSFGPDLRKRDVVAVLLYAAIWLIATIGVLRRGSAEASPRLLGLCVFNGLVMGVAGLGFCLGLDCLNAWLDSSAPRPIPVLVQSRRTEKRHTKYGRRYNVTIARVTRLDRPSQAFDVPWDSCHVPAPAVASPFAAVNVAPGAFGIPWLSLPVLCHPLAVSDKPLYGPIFFGKGMPLMLVAVGFEDPPNMERERREGEAVIRELDDIIDGRAFLAETSAEEAATRMGIFAEEEQRQLRAILTPVLMHAPGADATTVAKAARQLVRGVLAKRNPVHSLAVWKQIIDAEAPTVPVVVVWAGDPGDRLPGLQCPRCVVVPANDIDPDIYRLFSGRSEPGLGDDQIFLADATGRRVFEARLSDTAQTSTFAARLKAITGNK